MIILKDGVRYELWTPEDEVKDFEPMIIHHIKDIFGPGCKYFPKQKLKTLTNIRLIPDGFVVDFHNEKWYIVELKLLCDDAIRRISGQIVDYKNATRNQKTLRNIYKSIKIIRNADFLDDLINEENPEIIIVIDNLDGEQGRQFIEKVKGTEKNARIIEFKTFFREGVDPKKAHIHLFEPLYKLKTYSGLKNLKIEGSSLMTEESIEQYPLIFEGKETKATALYLGPKIRVKKGAIGAPQKASLSKGNRKTFLKMKQEGVIESIKNRPGYWRLKMDYIFSSPSAAASILQGSSQNGLKCWVNEKGVTLKELLREEKV